MTTTSQTEYERSLFVFSDIRGDFKLLHTLLTQIMKVASQDPDSKRWQWNVENTTCVCTGNFTDRYGQRGYNRLLITTSQAIADEIRILQCFQELTAQARKKNNKFVVLMGDHEIGNLLNWSSYSLYQMQTPDNVQDQEARQIFVNSYLKPFAEKYGGLLARWGVPGSTLYFSHAGLELSWLDQWIPKNRQQQFIPYVNTQFRRWLQQNNFVRLAVLEDPRSVVLSHKMSETPNLWREEDSFQVIKMLGADPQPRFVVSDMPIQLQQQTTMDLLVRSADCKGVSALLPSVLTSRSYFGDDNILFINNAMADVFCVYDDADRKPQAVQFSIHFNFENFPLYMNCDVQTLSDAQYQVYLSQRRFGSCAPRMDDVLFRNEQKGLTHEESSIVEPLADKYTQDKLSQRYNNVVSAYILLFDKTQEYVLLHQLNSNQKGETNNQNNLSRWVLPGGVRQGNESAWKAMQRGFANMIGASLPELNRDGQHYDYQDDKKGVIRIYAHSTYKEHLQLPHGTWVKFKNVYRYKLVSVFRLALCQMMQLNVISKVGMYESQCMFTGD